MISRILYFSVLSVALAGAAEKPPTDPPPQPANADAVAAKPEVKSDQRTELNLLGKIDTEKGESRRNENVQFNLIDNNTRKELNSRVGTSATIVQRFQPDRNYFGVEFGGSPAAPLHVAASKGFGIHGMLFETHNNSVFSARTFFQV